MKNKGKRTFVVSFDWQDFFDNLKKPNEKIKLLNAMFAYAQKQERLPTIEKSMDKDTAMAWVAIKRAMSYFEEDYEEKCAKNRANASLGGQAKARNRVANASERYQTLATVSDRCPNDNDYDYDTKEKYIQKKSSERYSLDELLQSSFSDTEVASKFKDFLNMRANLPNNKEVSTVETFDALVTKLRSLAKDKAEALQVLNNSIINNLTDLYPPKKQKGDEGGVKYAN